MWHQTKEAKEKMGKITKCYQIRQLPLLHNICMAVAVKHELYHVLGAKDYSKETGDIDSKPSICP